MIPKIIHYCWFGGKPLPESAIKCIESWKKFMPDYEIKRWDESNYDVNKCHYMKDSYKAKKYGFVPDYARFDILYQYGGVYIDTDVEFIKPLDAVISRGPFMGIETGNIRKFVNKKKHTYIAPGLIICAEPKMPVLKELLQLYESRSFIKQNGELDLTTSCVLVTNFFFEKKIELRENLAFSDGFYFYPPEYFNPKGQMRAFGRIKLTDNTYTIHHYDVSWKGKKEIKITNFFRKIIERKRYKK